MVFMNRNASFNHLDLTSLEYDSNGEHAIQHVFPKTDPHIISIFTLQRVQNELSFIFKVASLKDDISSYDRPPKYSFRALAMYNRSTVGSICTPFNNKTLQKNQDYK